MKKVIIIISVIVVGIIAIGMMGGDKRPAKAPVVTSEKKTTEFPSAMTETMDKQAMLSCGGGQNVTLWLNPTSDIKNNRARAKVACGNVRVFNKFYNKTDKLTFYALETKDLEGKLTYGWVTDDFITFN
jgi:hypothetical protein